MKDVSQQVQPVLVLSKSSSVRITDHINHY